MSNYPQVDPVVFRQLTDLSMSKSFLVPEFLLWYWFKSANHPVFSLKIKELPDPVTCEIGIADYVAFVSPHSLQLAETVLKGPVPASSQIAHESLAEGRLIKKMRICIQIQEIGEYLATISAKSLTPSGIKLPVSAHALWSDQKPEDINPQLLSIFLDVYEYLQTEFMEKRLTPEWKNSILPDIDIWIKSKAQKNNQTMVH